MTSHSTTRTLALLLIVAFTGSFVVATGASISGPADTIADDRVVIQPGENTDYAYLDANDELVLDFTAANPKLDADGEGVNLYAFTGFSDLFTITYTADEPANVWITYGDEDDDQLTFTVDGQPIDRENNVTLTQDQSISVGLTINTTETNVMTGQISEDEFSIHAKPLYTEDSGTDDDPSGDGGTDDGQADGDNGDDDPGLDNDSGPSSSSSGGADDDESDGTEDGDSTGSDDGGADGNDSGEFEDGNNGDGAGAAGGEDDDEPVEEPGGFELIDLTYLLLILLMVIILLVVRRQFDEA